MSLDQFDSGQSAGGRTPFFKRHYSQCLSIAEVIVDFLAIVSGVLVGISIFLYTHPGGPENWYRFIWIAVITAVIGVAIFERFGLYRQQCSLMNLVEVRKVVRAVLALYLAVLLYSFFTKTGYPRSVFIYASCSTLFFVLVERMLFFKLQQALYIRGVNVRRVLIIGAQEDGRLLCQSIRQAPKFGYFVVGFFDQDKKDLLIAKDWFGKGKHKISIFCDDFSSLKDVVCDEEIDEIFISKQLRRDGEYDLRELVTFCREHKVTLNFIPYFKGFYSAQIQVNDINGIPLISFGSVPLCRSGLLIKRIFDLILTTIAMVVLSPLFILLSILVKRDSSGPIFFKQDRVGKDGVHFPMYKFRSMYVDTPQYGISPRSSEDPRITKMGRFLRRTSLDELPQLINVLRGDMSLVGPRPEMPFIVDNEYNDLYRERLRVQPGITGVWQISCDRSREIHENISYDIFYIENRSLLLDIIILIRTVIFGVMAMHTH